MLPRLRDPVDANNLMVWWRCAQTAQCTAGNCIATCLSSALTQCQTGQGPFCANLQTDPNYCGSCVKSCPSDANNHGSRLCTGGVRAHPPLLPVPMQARDAEFEYLA